MKYRKQVWYEGRVQGVGFRYKACQIARGYDICGQVRNVDDGRVHLTAVGEKNEVEKFVSELEESMKDFIKSKEDFSDVYDGKYKGFQIVS